MIDARHMKKLLYANGYTFMRCKGSHFIYSDGTNMIVVNKDLNAMVATRLIKTYHLQMM